MPLVLNEEQALLKRTAEEFFAAKAPVAALRDLRDTADPDGFSRALWREMAEMGWAGTFLPEACGGIGCGFTEFGVVMEAAGRTLVASPLLATVALGASAVLLAGSEAQKAGLLPAIAAGELLMALALEEGPHHRPGRVATTATRRDAGYVINGCKRHVLDGHVADRFVVTARTSGALDGEAGISLFLVDAGSPGLSVERRSMVDSRNMADVRFDEVAVADADLLGAADQGYGVLGQVLDRGNVALAAEMLGSALAAFERTVAYLKQREQFGRTIGSFQALQHRASKMFCELELSKSVVLAALRAVDEHADDLSLLASLAKLQVSEALRLVSDEGIQMHGGIGMTDEEDIGLYLKRARVAQQTLGDEHFHLQRYAALKGY